MKCSKRELEIIMAVLGGLCDMLMRLIPENKLLSEHELSDIYYQLNKIWLELHYKTEEEDRPDV